MTDSSLTLRAVQIEGRGPFDVRLRDGRIEEIGRGLTGGPELDGRGGALIPGLLDHHLHLLAAAAKAESIDLASAVDPPSLEQLLRRELARRPAGDWVRAVGYHQWDGDVLDRAALDTIAPRHRLRVAHQSGSLWILNSAALDSLGADDGPSCVERDPQGRPSGRIWRGDAWLHSRLPRAPPPLAPLGQTLSAFGVTGVTDASATTDESAAALLSTAGRAGDLPQRLVLMSHGALAAPEDGAYTVGPVKVLLDEHALPDFGEMTDTIARARSWGRTVAFHCVTAAELAFALAGLDTAGALPGDRIEHGSVIPSGAIDSLARLGLTVVTQSGFVMERGDRYLTAMPSDEHDDLYRCASLSAAGIAIAGSSDAPYGSLDPWQGMAAAVARRTAAGRPVGSAEALSPQAALSLYQGDLQRPGAPSRRVAVGQPADLCLLRVPLRDALASLDAQLVAATIIGGRLVHLAP
jgi:predicted amidohydrolase YtcJ